MSENFEFDIGFYDENGIFNSLDTQASKACYEFFEKNNDEYLHELLRSGENLTHATRHFIADVLSGAVKIPRGQSGKKYEERDMRIYYNVLMKIYGGMPLTSGRSSGAAAIVAEQERLSEDALIKIYHKVKKQLSEEFKRLVENGLLTHDPVKNTVTVEITVKIPEYAFTKNMESNGD